MKKCSRKMSEVKKSDDGARQTIIKQENVPPEEEPLVVPKVIRQYTRKKKEHSAANKLPSSYATTDALTATLSDQHFPNGKDNHVKIKEQNVPNMEDQNFDVNSNPKISEVTILNTIHSMKSCSFIGVENVKIKEENVCEIGAINTIDITSDCNLIEKEQQIPRSAQTSIKIEPVDEIQDIKLDITVHKNNTAERQSVPVVTITEGNANSIKPKSKIIECSAQLPDEVCLRENTEINVNHEADKGIMNYNPPKVDGENKSQITEELHIKEEIESDTDTDCELATVTQNGCPETVDVKKELSTEPVEEPSGMIKQSSIMATGKTRRLVELKKCYLVAVNVATADSKIGTPEDLAPFKVVAKSEIFTCHMCDEHFLSDKEVRRHVGLAHRVEKPYQCKECPVSYPYYYLLLAHLRRHTGRPLDCDLCLKRFKTHSTYGVHLNSHLRERLYSCPVCLRRFTNLDGLYRHTPRHASGDVFKCEACVTQYSSAIDLRRHRERTHAEKCHYPCYVCARELQSERDFYKHLDAHADAVYECAFCPKRFTEVRRWEEHSADHIDKINMEKTFGHSCGICQKRFMWVSILKTHMRCHTEERPYSCQICSRGFKTRSALTEHERGHARPYACTECDARFGKRDTLERHSRRHSGERPYSCTTCLAAFAQRSSLLLHIRRQHTPCLKRVLKGRPLRKKSKTKKI